MKAVFRIGRLCFIFINYSINAIQKAINSARLFDCIKLDWLRKKFATINVNWKTIWIKNKKDERKTMSKQVGDLSIENVKQVCHIFSSSLYISINRIYFRTVFKQNNWTAESETPVHLSYCSRRHHCILTLWHLHNFYVFPFCACYSVLVVLLWTQCSKSKC